MGSATKLRGSKRTGLIHYEVTPIALSELPAVQAELGTHQERVLRWLTSVEEKGVECLVRHGLPATSGLIQRPPGGEWRISDGRIRMGWNNGWAWSIAEDQSEPDTELWLVSRMLKALHLLRLLLQMDQPDPWALAHGVQRVSDFEHTHRLEFGYGFLGAAVKQQPHWSRGGSERAKARKTKARAEEEELFGQCQAIWDRSPELSAKRIAELLCRGTDKNVDTIRKKVAGMRKKPGAALSTMPTR